MVADKFHTQIAGFLTDLQPCWLAHCLHGSVTMFARFSGGNRAMDAETAVDSVGPLSYDSRQCHLLVQSVSDYAIYLLDTAGFVRSWNPGGERIKGYSADEVLGTLIDTQA